MKKQLIENIKTEYNKKRLKAAREADLRKEELYERIPGLEEINRKISLASIELSKLYLSKPDDIEEQVLELKEKITCLKKNKDEFYNKYNIPKNFTEPNYQCSNCNDTGYTLEGKRCNCMNKQIINYLYDISNMIHMLKRENFDTFDINIFSNELYNKEKLTPRQNMYKILETCEDFCNNFDDVNMNLLFYGGTGLGKTFMCNCIAKALIDMEKSVFYQTAFHLFEIVENHKFYKQTETEENRISYNMIFDCDLLIIDDLGTEFNNSFTNAEIFNILNERLITEKKTIISTNLSLEQMAETYSDRIMSRVFSNYAPLKFYGKDLRWESK
ncbi:ATP-binding protein [Sedimentibacter sp. MB31-C6]|uniref:ATP-binding protein n=1 Tax=Sedimentibacter sp. MB31-C6 TaxID=3109366 RepID=UPI002DDD7696|nr:ATP-binding protein [Sedimentibacter sp. MB36-C1]WSI05387.1 ATP-binding protein [Sedimentibacter sp. MB36-C1]